MKGAVTGHATVERSEGETIRRAQRGDVVAFECLYKAHSKRVYSVCLRMLKNTSDAEDLTQAFFAHFLDRNCLARASQQRGRFRSFLLTSLQNFLAHEWEKARAAKRQRIAAPSGPTTEAA